MFLHLTSDQQSLASAMSEISEASYSAGWMSGLEFALWHLLVSGRKNCGRYRLSEEERLRLATLSSRCAGWITFDVKDGEVFVPLEDWKRTFATEAHRHLSDDDGETA